MTERIMIAPSLLSANFARLEDDIRACEIGGADMLHLDVMDGRFVPNISFGQPVVSAIRAISALPLDCHLMIVEPERYVSSFIEAGASWVSVHVEACVHLHRTLELIRAGGAKAGVVLNPLTPLDYAFEAAGWSDFILLMSVNPGFGGQSFIPTVLRRIEHLRSWLEREGIEIPIEVDGGVGVHNAADLVQAGATVLVSGAGIFKGEITQNVSLLRQAAKRVAKK